jgi:HSP20 family molecular chaperone IbpA
MKTTRLTKGQWGAVIALFGVCGLIAVAIAGPHMIHAAEHQTASSNGGFLAPLKQWQEKMSEAFLGALKNITGGGDASKSPSSVSADLREQNDSYTLRLNLPNRSVDKVEVNLEGNRLRIVAPEEGTARRYEQTITLGDVPADAQPRVERKAQDHLIVVTVPKSSSPGAVAVTPPDRRTNDPDSVFRRDQDIMDSMERMRRNMDRIFDESFRNFGMMPDLKGLFDQHRFSSTYDIDDQGDKYVVRAYLPDRDMDNVSVTVEGQTLHIEARAEDSARGSKGKDQPETRVHRAQYTQSVTLPGPVDSLKMTVDRKDHMLVINLPKAKSS